MARKKNDGVDVIVPARPSAADMSSNPNRPRVKVGCGSPNSGTIDLPNYSSDPSVSRKPGNLSFTEAIDTGYSPNREGGVNMTNPNGSTASSRGQGSTINFQWANGIDGEANETHKFWNGSNRTGE